MGWHRLTLRELPEALSFLQRQEALTVNATGCLRLKPPLGLGAPQSVILGAKPSRKAALEAVLVARGKSLFLPILSDPVETLVGAEQPEGVWNRHLLATEVAPQIIGRSSTYFNLMGPARWVHPIEKALPWRPYQRLSYDLMVEAEPLRPRELPAELTIEVISSDLVDAYFPLQEAYEKEEVLFDPRDFNAVASRHFFVGQVRRELTLGLRYQGRPVAKAGTNATGFEFAQIGGVYCHPEFRGRGFSTALMIQLMAKLSVQNRRATLFVKKTNPAARALYQKLGFKILEDFLIAYYQKN